MRETDTRMNMFRVGDGEQAIAFLQRGGIFSNAAIPELVILDVNLPKRSGFDVLAVIRDMEPLKCVPVVMFSSSTLPAHRERATALGAVAFFQKTGDWDGFVETAKCISSMVPQRPASRG
jgi:CheY-like chemotaxis protein